jgi:HPt (histidine-containing phosphotransfer) domain-containing protein
VYSTGNTTTTQMSQKELEMRFLTRTRQELEQMRACVPDTQLPIEPLEMSHLEQLAAKISKTAEAFGFQELTVIAGAIELLSQTGASRITVRERLALATRLTAQLGALEVHLEYEILQREAYRFDEDAETFSISA